MKPPAVLPCSAALAFAAAAFGGPVAWILAWCAVFAACAWKGVRA